MRHYLLLQLEFLAFILLYFPTLPRGECLVNTLFTYTYIYIYDIYLCNWILDCIYNIYKWIHEIRAEFPSSIILYAARTLSHADPHCREPFRLIKFARCRFACTARETHFIPVERRKSSHCRTGEGKKKKKRG